MGLDVIGKSVALFMNLVSDNELSGSSSQTGVEVIVPVGLKVYISEVRSLAVNVVETRGFVGSRNLEIEIPGVITLEVRNLGNGTSAWGEASR